MSATRQPLSRPSVALHPESEPATVWKERPKIKKAVRPTDVVSLRVTCQVDHHQWTGSMRTFYVDPNGTTRTRLAPSLEEEQLYAEMEAQSGECSKCGSFMFKSNASDDPEKLRCSKCRVKASIKSASEFIAVVSVAGLTGLLLLSGLSSDSALAQTAARSIAFLLASMGAGAAIWYFRRAASLRDKAVEIISADGTRSWRAGQSSWRQLVSRLCSL